MRSTYYEVATNRPNVVATRKGTGGGRSLIWAAHTDVVPVTPEQREVWVGSGPFSGEVIDGKLYGRGASDMKGAIAAYVMAARILRDEGVELQGDLILAQSPGEEAGRRDIGCNTVLERGHRADFAIFPEPSNFAIYPTIKGELYFKLTVPRKVDAYLQPASGRTTGSVWIGASRRFRDRQHAEVPARDSGTGKAVESLALQRARPARWDVHQHQHDAGWHLAYVGTGQRRSDRLAALQSRSDRD